MPFATPEDVATRLGRDLNALEAGTVEFLLLGADAVIAEALGQNDAWATALSPVPVLLRIVEAEMVARALGNPENAVRVSEAIGVHSRAVDYRELYDGGGLWLTPMETGLLRRTFGSGVGSARLGSLVVEDPYA